MHSRWGSTLRNYEHGNVNTRRGNPLKPFVGGCSTGFVREDAMRSVVNIGMLVQRLRSGMMR